MASVWYSSRISHPLLGLDRLVQALVVAPADQRATGVLVDDQDLAVEIDVVAVELEQLLGLDARCSGRRSAGCWPTRTGCRCPAGPRPRRCRARGWRRSASSRRPRSAASPLQPVDELGELGYHSWESSAGPEMISGVRASSTRIESTSSTIAKWCSRWTQSSMAERHVVAQVVEAELVVRAVGDVAS